MSAIHTRLRGSPRRLFIVFVTLLMAVGYTLVTVAPATALYAVADDETTYKSALGALSASSAGPHTLELAGDVTFTSSSQARYTGSQDLVIEGNGYTIDAAGLTRALYVTPSVPITLTLRNVTFVNGSIGGPGGGVYMSQGDLVAHDSAFLDHHASGDYGGVGTNDGSVTLVRSTVAGNSAEDGAGVGGDEISLVASTISGNRSTDEAGGVFAAGDIEVINSTVTGNEAAGSRLGGGGIHARGIVTLINATIVGNDANRGANISFDGNPAYTIGISSFGSVVADPIGSGNCSFDLRPDTNFTGTTSTYTYADDDSCGFTDTTDVENGSDPMLGALGDNGGSTLTMLPTDMSPLVDAIPAGSCDATYLFDQRGVARPQGSSCDIGAVELLQNQAPVADANGPYVADEGSLVMLDGSGSSDPDGDPLTFDWDVDNDGTFETPGEMPDVSFPDNGFYPVAVRVTDGGGLSDVATTTVTVSNVSPTITAVTGPAGPVQTDEMPIGITVDFVDPGLLDTHEVTWDWGDGSTDSFAAASPAVASHSYATGGTYTVGITVVDDDGGVAVTSLELEVIQVADAKLKPRRLWLSDDDGEWKVDRPGVMRMFIYSTALFDATTIDRATIEIGDPDLGGTVGVFKARKRDANKDGLKDLVVWFRTRKLLRNGGVGPDTTYLQLSGNTSEAGVIGLAPIRIRIAD